MFKFSDFLGIGVKIFIEISGVLVVFIPFFPLYPALFPAQQLSPESRP